MQHPHSLAALGAATYFLSTLDPPLAAVGPRNALQTLRLYAVSTHALGAGPLVRGQEVPILGPVEAVDIGQQHYQRQPCTRLH